jgi:hypothetical protein
MLTNQHRKATRCITNPERRVYKHYMCGVCHALGDDYGLASRIFTNHETILLNMLTDAQMETSSETVMRRCPLRPTHHVKTNQNTSSQFAAAITVLLVNAGVVDDRQDGKGLNLPARLLEKALSGMSNSARSVLDNLSFDTRPLKMLPTQQFQAESNGMNPLAPSMQSSSAIFAMTAQLAGSPQNQKALAGIGANYGAYVYLYDALEDWGKDFQKGEFNPLLPYLQEQLDRITLTSDGIKWIRDQFTRILTNIREDLRQVKFHQHADVIQKLLTDPIERILNNLAKVSDGISIRKVSRLDVLKTAFLMTNNEPETPDSMDDFFKDEDDHPNYSKKKDKKDSNRNNSCYGDACYWGSCDCGDGCDGCGGDGDSSSGGLDCNPFDGDGCDCGGGDSCGGDGCDISGCDGADCSGGDCSC